MNSITHLSNSALIQQLRKLIEQEREVLTQILWHLHAVETRKLFAEAGYSSLFEYVVQELGYSESAAFRRISAMRLLKTLPTSEVKNIESALQSGTLNLSKLTLAQEYFKHQQKKDEPVAISERTKIISDLESKSVRECVRYFAVLAPETIPQEKTRALTEDKTEIKLIVSSELLEKIKRFKHLQSHVKHDASMAEVLEMAMDVALVKKDPTQKSLSLLPTSKVKSTSNVKSASSPRFIPASTKRFIWSRDQEKCTYQNPTNGKQCGSTYQLQIDHIHPIVFHGDSDPKNLRLLCRIHNVLASQKSFGRLQKSG